MLTFLALDVLVRVEEPAPYLMKKEVLCSAGLFVLLNMLLSNIPIGVTVVYILLEPTYYG